MRHKARSASEPTILQPARPHGATPVLQLDIQGTPQAWITLEQAAIYVATESVAWFDGDGVLATLRGGFNVARGRQSEIDIHPIIALHGAPRLNLFDVTPAFTKSKLLRRDRFQCAYCAGTFHERDLTCEHILPQSRGGLWSWSNLVSSCRICNTAKGARTPEEANMPLMYLPYTPSRYEDFLLQGRNIRADVHDWLASRLPKGSRLC